MKNLKSCILFTILIILIIPLYSLADQDILVSKKVPKANQLPVIATNPNTGDVLIVWNQWDYNDFSYSRVWCALLKRQNDGNYKIRKAYMVSPKNGYHNNIYATWIPSNDEFFAVWDTNGTSQSGSSKILGRAINKKRGKPTGSVLEIVSDGNVNYTPLIMAGSEDDNQYFRLIYSSLSNPSVNPSNGNQGTTQIVSTAVTKEIKVDGTRRLTLFGTDSDRAALGSIVSENTTEDTYTVSLVNESGPGMKAHIILTKNGEEIDRFTFSNSFGEHMSMTVLPGDSQGGVVASLGVTWGEFEGGELKLRRGAFVIENGWSGISPLKFFDPEAQTFSQAMFEVGTILYGQSGIRHLDYTSPRSGNNSSHFRNPLPPKSAFMYYLTANRDGWIYLQKLDDTLKTFGKKTKLFSHGNNLIGLNVVGIPVGTNNSSVAAKTKTPNAIAVWEKLISPVNYEFEIRAHFFYVKPNK